MTLVGCDLHSRKQLAALDTTTGDTQWFHALMYRLGHDIGPRVGGPTPRRRRRRV